jgi:hypothetical protein
MNIKRLLGYSTALFVLMGSVALAGPGKGLPPIKVGPVAIIGADDIGTCNNVWALDSFNKFYTITANHDGTYNLQVDYKNGTFVSNAGSSPGACESGSDNGETIAADVTGKTQQQYNATVTSLATPDRTPDCAANNGCAGSGNVLDAVFGAGNWSKTDFGWVNHYEAGRSGTWFDTDVNWPLNDRGDINTP